MKKTLFLLAAAATCTACSMDETTEVNNGLPIDFRTAVATRGTPIETSSLNAFQVWAFFGDGTSYFDNETFTKNAAEGNCFTSTTEHYWPTEDELTFYAYAPTDLDNSTPNFTKDSKSISYKPESKIEDQDDFITAMNTGSKTDQETGVEMTFKHRLSQIEVKAYYTGTRYTIKVFGAQIANVYESGTYTFATDVSGDGSWETSGNKVSYTAECTETELTSTESSSDATSITEEKGNWMLIPQTGLSEWSTTDATNTSNGTYLAVKIQIKENDGSAIIYPKLETSTGEESEWAAVPIEIDWEQNNKYIYTLHFTDTSAGVIPPGPSGGEEILGDPIKFAVTTTVEEWSNIPDEKDMP